MGLNEVVNADDRITCTKQIAVFDRSRCRLSSEEKK